MGKDLLIGIILGVTFGLMGILVKGFIKQRPLEQFFLFFVVLYTGKFVVMAGVLFLTLNFFSSNSFICMCSFLSAFTFWKFLKIYKIFKDSLKVA